MMIFRSASWHLLSNIIGMLIGIAQISIVSRAYDISLFGQLSIALVILNIVQSVADIGMSNYLVHVKNVSKELISSVFWLSVASGIFFGAITAGAAPIISSLYNYSSLSYFLIIVALSFPFIGAIGTFQAGSIRNSELVKLAKVELFSKVIGFLSFLLMIYLNLGAECLLVANLIVLATKLVVLYASSNHEFRPCFNFGHSDLKKALRYGLFQVGSQIINQIRLNLDVLVLGFVVPATTLGYYSLAKQLVSKPVSLINPIIGRIGLNQFAMSQGDISKLKQGVLNALKINSILLGLIYFCFILQSDQIVTLFFGQSNIETDLYILPLALFWMARYLVGAVVGPLVQAIGRTDKDFFWNLLTFLVFLFIVVISSRYGALVLATSLYIMQMVLSFGVYLYFYRELVGINMKEFISSVMFSPILAFFTYAFLKILNVKNVFESIISSVLVTSVIFLLFYSILIYVFNRSYFVRVKL
ncbi:oligosaccharide flippase family protein [Vibrio viridaestus]|uniref:Colanic acid exporter n=1 Tax=Vibrio viridaestus TaxID=2487322 RepID=A0A3N9TI56_9VIBR|nr:oligosaccharide flippase family protein [Vibrio viridaestus]RQW63879.1 hypothetical protein EES38_04535 [Vibrio viridaestus]